MGSKGDAYDNAVAESFFATLETELLWRHAFRNRNEARLAIFDFVEAFYNRERLHSSIGQLPPVEFEKRFHARISLCQQARRSPLDRGNSRSRTRPSFS